MGFPMPFSAFLRRSFFSFTGFWDSPILTRGLWDSPCPFPPFSEGLLFLELSYSLQHRMTFSWFFITATRPRSLGRHGLYLEFDHELTSCNRFRMTIQYDFNPQDLQNYPKFLNEFPTDHHKFEGQHLCQSRIKKENLLHEDYPTT